MIVYFNGKYLPKDKVHISPDDRGFLFADGIYEVIRIYRGSPFEMDAHLARMRYGLDAIRLPLGDLAFLKDVVRKLIGKNALSDGTADVYIQVTRGVYPRRHRFPPPECRPTVYATAVPSAPNRRAQQRGVAAVLVPDIRWARCDIKSVALLPNVLACQRAHDDGAAEALFVKDGAVVEGSHSSFFAVFNGTLRAAPESNYMLGGITRRIVIRLAEKLGIPVRLFPVLENEMAAADELMIVGTGTEITPVIKVQDRKIAGGKPGPITRKLQKAFAGFVRAQGSGVRINSVEKPPVSRALSEALSKRKDRHSVRTTCDRRSDKARDKAPDKVSPDGLTPHPRGFSTESIFAV